MNDPRRIDNSLYLVRLYGDDMQYIWNYKEDVAVGLHDHVQNNVWGGKSNS